MKITRQNNGGETLHVLLLTHILRNLFVVNSGINKNVTGHSSVEVRLVCFLNKFVDTDV